MAGRLAGVLDAELKDGSLDRITGLAGIGLLSARVLAEGAHLEAVVLYDLGTKILPGSNHRA